MHKMPKSEARKWSDEFPGDFPQSVMDSFCDAVYIIDVRNYRILDCNSAFLEKYGLSGSQATERPCYELTHHLSEPCQAPYDICPLSEALKTGRHSQAEHIHFLANGEKVYEELSASPIVEENGEIRRVVNVARDITERKRVEEALVESESRFRGLAEQSLVGIYLTQDDILRYVNPKICEIFGYGPEELVGRRGLKEFILPEDWPKVQENLRRRVSGEVDAIHYEFRGVTKDKRLIDLEVYGTRTVVDGKPAVIGTLLDITERKRAERSLAAKAQELETLALVDELTGLYNRRGFLVLAEQQLKTARRLEKGILLIFVDLDGFKKINDLLGHQVGDAALQEAAELFRETFRQSDIVGRWGGDEFTMMLQGVDAEGESEIFSRLEQNLARLNAAKGRVYRLSLSIGTAGCAPGRPCSLEKLVERADAMMYRRKNARKKREPEPSDPEFIVPAGETP